MRDALSMDITTKAQKPLMIGLTLVDELVSGEMYGCENSRVEISFSICNISKVRERAAIILIGNNDRILIFLNYYFFNAINI